MLRPTPETDALVPKFLDGGEIPDVFAHCRKLEQERDEAQKELEYYKARYEQLKDDREMSKRPTPETDAFIASQNHSPTTHQLRNFARIFERERDEAREETLQQARLLGMSGERECKIIAERDEALQQEKIHYDNLVEMKQKFDHEATENMLSTNKICNERDEAMDVLSNLSHYLSCGLGDENTTAKEYGARIREGINALLDPIVEEKDKLREMLHLQTMIEVDLRMKSME